MAVLATTRNGKRPLPVAMGVCSCSTVLAEPLAGTATDGASDLTQDAGMPSTVSVYVTAVLADGLVSVMVWLAMPPMDQRRFGGRQRNDVVRGHHHRCQRQRARAHRWQRERHAAAADHVAAAAGCMAVTVSCQVMGELEGCCQM